MCSGHPNIVTVFDVYDNVMRRGPRDRRPATRVLLVVMEYMEVRPLHDHIVVLVMQTLVTIAPCV